ncbi:SLC13 family permease [Compostimonas suwonensis]|uniref:Na+/H+ antiporter NhaD/arsenite permease-like protein n=1 Tax=Compostimonas suwonensis TaxID=1048394 RepID=A0A2M9BBD6_9MICO|nr:SLC13 family permease [Compostimonas suwonensis]PJJ55262.1 Na+/H+ antiporter NhaD/arsenite permease-like protein [Compostimonas suwonensis]
MRSALVGAILLVLGVIAIPLGVLSPSDAAELVDRVWPILVFVVAITVVAELASEAGVFRWLAEKAALAGRGRVLWLWLLVVALATASTVFLSLDTTAVLLTPVVVVLARHSGISPIPFALTTVWLANTASLLLPVSNLTNLLAEHALGGVGPGDFARLTWAPAIVAVVVPVAVVAVLFRRQLRESYSARPAGRIEDPVRFGWSCGVLIALLPALVSGMPVWIPASAAAVLLVVVAIVRTRELPSWTLVPWSLVLLAAGLFLFLEAAHALGLGVLLSAVSGRGDGLGSLLQLSGVGAVGANAINNLPAYLALEPVADSPARLVALLIGVNAGPLITPWASLATLLWHERLVALGVRIPWRRYVLLGLVVAPVTVVAATIALWILVLVPL